MINISNFSFKIWFYAVSTVNEVSLEGTRWLPFSARQSAESLINYTSCEFAAHSVVAVDTVAVSFSYTHFSLFPHISPYCTHICHWTWSVVLHARTILLLLHLCCIIHHIVIEETRASVISLSLLIVLLKKLQLMRMRHASRARCFAIDEIAFLYRSIMLSSDAHSWLSHQMEFDRSDDDFVHSSSFMNEMRVSHWE